MCGICGIFNLNTNAEPIGSGEIATMMNTILHRGPDGKDQFIDPTRYGVGFTRLSIIDLQGGMQPLLNEAKDVVVVCNGEIYNHESIRGVLIRRGHVLNSHSDCEVIAHLYEDYGDAFVDHLRGMFAIALWDKRCNKLIMVRDRIGKKQLYYTIADNRLLFASEIKAIFALARTTRAIDPEALYQLFLNGFVMQPRTLYRDVQYIRAGHITSCQDGEIALKQYWDYLIDAEEVDVSEEVVENFRERLRDSVHCRLVADVPVHFMLSGGLDSSSIVALASLCTNPVHSHSMVFDEEEFDESAYSSLVSEHFGTDHSQVRITGQLLELLPQALLHMEVPHFSPNILSHYFLSKTLKGRTKVLVTGEGADEMLCGYDEYIFDTMLGYDASVLQSRAVELQARVAENFNLSVDSLIGHTHALDPCYRYLFWRNITKVSEIQRLFSPRMTEDQQVSMESVANSMFRPEAFRTTNSMKKQLYLDKRTRMQSLHVLQLDKLYMANGIEVRLPFLDHQFAEFCQKLRAAHLFNGETEKLILRNAMAGLLPDQIRLRRKQGLRSPLKQWFKMELPQFATDLLSKESLSAKEYFNPKTVTKMLGFHRNGYGDFSNILYLVLLTQLCDELFVSNTPCGADCCP